MKSIVIAGNIGKSAETRTTQRGDKVTSWSLAVEDRSQGEKRTIWFECEMWGNRGEILAQYLTKGGKVAVSGEFSTREYEGKTKLTVKADQVTLLGGKPDGERNDYQAPAKREAAPRDDIDADSIPF